MSNKEPQTYSIEPIIKTAANGMTYRYYPKPDDFTPVDTFPTDHRWFGNPRCQGWSKQSGRQCLERATRGTTKCYHHGGRSPSGLASPNFRTGKYVNSLPMDLVANYVALMHDEDYLSLRNEIAVVSMRINDVFGRMYADGFPDIGELRRAMLNYDDAARKADNASTDQGRDKWTADMDRHLDTVRDMIYSLDDHRAGWGEVDKLSNTLRRLVDTDRKRVTEGRAMMRADDALTRATMLAKSVKRHVDDPQTIAAIWDDFTRIMKGEQLS